MTQIRPCDVYNDEYKDCTSFKSRFHQYFIYGETLDCTQWKKDQDNCERWTEKRNLKAREELIKSEKLRQATRLSGHLLNDTWENRSEPPPDWNKPLPEWMQKEHENSYLALKAKEMKEGELQRTSGERTFCVIS